MVAPLHHRPILVSAWFESYLYGPRYRTNNRRTVSAVNCSRLSLYPLACSLAGVHHPFLLRYSRPRVHRRLPIASSSSSGYHQTHPQHPPLRYALLHPACSNQCHRRDTLPSSADVTRSNVCVCKYHMVSVLGDWDGLRHKCNRA